MSGLEGGVLNGGNDRVVAINRYIVNTVRCAGCNALKGAVNHWWLVTMLDGLFTVEPLTEHYAIWDRYDQPVCGRACAQNKLEEFLAQP